MTCRWRSAFSCWLTRAGCPRLPSWHVHTCPAWYLGTVHCDTLLSTVHPTYILMSIIPCSLAIIVLLTERMRDRSPKYEKWFWNVCTLFHPSFSLFVLCSSFSSHLTELPTTSISPVSRSTISIRHSSFFSSSLFPTFCSHILRLHFVPKSFLTLSTPCSP